VVTFKKEDTEMKIKVAIIDDEDWNPDSSFVV
jgi:hypothetical protein